MRTLLYQRIKKNSIMLANASSLVGTTAVTMALGLPYWWLAARLFTPEAVGLSSAALSAMTLLGTFCVLGMGTLLMGELPRQRGNEGALISAALLLVGGVSSASGILFALIAPLFSASLHFLSADIQSVGLFALGVSLTAVTMVLDQALTGLLRSDLQFWRNTFFAVIKLALIFFAGFLLSQANKGNLAIYATWTLGNLLSLLALAGLAGPQGRWLRNCSRPCWSLLRKLGTAAGQHHTLNLMLQTPSLVLPIIVTVLLSAEANAWFYVSWMIANLASLVPYVLATVLYATTTVQPEMLRSKARLTLAISIVLSVIINIVLFFGSEKILGIFGSVYAEQAQWSLRLLALGAFPRIIRDHYVTICRVQGQVARAMLPMTVGSLLELGIAALGAFLGGLTGLSLGWVLAVSLEAVFGLYTVYKTIQPEEKAIQKMKAMGEVIHSIDDKYCLKCNEKLPTSANDGDLCGACSKSLLSTRLADD